MSKSTVFSRLATLPALILILAWLALVAFPAGYVGASPEARITVRDIQNLSPQTITVTSTQTITPARSFMLFNSSGVVTVTLSEGVALVGDQLLIVNMSANNVTITPTNTTLAAPATLGDRDVLKLVYADGVWVDEYTQNN